MRLVSRLVGGRRQLVSIVFTSQTSQMMTF